MTLISIHNSEGCVGRCDSRCYGAVGEKCECCCGGMNHGKGLGAAKENTAHYTTEIVDRWEHSHPGGDERILVDSQQGELFEEVGA